MFVAIAPIIITANATYAKNFIEMKRWLIAAVKPCAKLVLENITPTAPVAENYSGMKK